MKEMPLAQKRGSLSAPGICLANSGAKVPYTVEAWQPTFSNTRPAHQRHDPAAAVSAAMVLAGPRGLHEAAGRLALAAGKPFGRVLDRLEARADQPLKLGEPGAGALFPRLAEGLGEAGLVGGFLVHDCHRPS